MARSVASFCAVVPHKHLLVVICFEVGSPVFIRECWGLGGVCVDGTSPWTPAFV